MLCKLPVIFVLICLAITSLSKLHADNGHPIAIRQWSDTGFTIETMQNMHVGIGLRESDLERLPRPVDLSMEDVKGKDNARLYWSVKTSSVATNIEGGQEGLGGLTEVFEFSESDVTFNDAAWRTPGATLFVDGVLIVNLNVVPANKMDAFLNAPSGDIEMEKSDLAIIATSNAFDVEQLKKIRDRLNPQLVIVHSSVDEVGNQKVETISHNTIAISAPAKFDRKARTHFVSLGDQPWEMTDDLAGLFAKKEAACKLSREMFAKLSVDQMNFKPSDGTHTPRWNSEHMMGRELLFFSQIFHAVDPNIPVMDLNPRQIPEDYTFAHSDWSGAEEAAQMMRVEAFTRRFAYLLEGIDLDTKAVGSKFWKPRGLLEQMERHYNQHSTNVVKKMDLGEWPPK